MTDSNDVPVADDAGLARVRKHVFVSYSHQDEDKPWYKNVMENLRQLDVGGEFTLWDDKKLEAGDDWQAHIEDKLGSAVAAVFLVTPGFLESEFISKTEVPSILERHEHDGLTVHALVCQDCIPEMHPIGEFLRTRQLVHKADTPLERLDEAERNKVLNDLVRKIVHDIGPYRGRNRVERRTKLVEEIEERTGLEIVSEVAGGDTSMIYRAKRQRPDPHDPDTENQSEDLAVKAMVSHRISDHGQKELLQEEAKCRGLRSPAFVRIHEITFRRGAGLVVADWVPGRSLQRILAGTTPLARHVQAMEWIPTLHVVLTLARALAEAHQAGLRYVTVTPSNIFMHRGEPKIYPIDFSTWLAKTAHANGMLAFGIETLEYLAPEYLAKRAQHDDLATPDSANQDTELELVRKAHQYALGMVTLAMLDGAPPVRVRALADIEHLLRFQADPRGFLVDGEHRLEDRPWRRAAPGLARVLWRMLERDPGQRWDSMETVVDQLRVVMNASAIVSAHVAEAKQSYLESLQENEDFYRCFYEALFRRAPDVAPMFARKDMVAQGSMLAAALERMLNFRPSQHEPTTLAAIAGHHQAYGLSAEHFDHFGMAFLEALDSVVKVDTRTRDAWEAVLWPALEYMKTHATTGGSGTGAAPRRSPRKKRGGK